VPHDLHRLRAGVGQDHLKVLAGLGVDLRDVVLHRVAGRDVDLAGARGGGSGGGGGCGGVLLAAAGVARSAARALKRGGGVVFMGTRASHRSDPGANRIIPARGPPGRLGRR
jgi:hypothetical protein